MTEGRATFPIEPWSLTEVGLDHASLAVHESVFALTNGHIGMRGSSSSVGTVSFARRSDCRAT